MGRIRRGGYIIKWFIGDHAPRHVHIETMTGVEGWQPAKKLLKEIVELRKEGRL